METTQKVVFLSGKKVNLRPLAQSDAPLITRWINDPEVREFIVGIYPQTEKQETEWLFNHSDKNIVLGIETKEGTYVGNMGIHDIDWINRTATTGAMIGEKEYWGKGYGTDAKMLLLDYAFNTLNLRKICSRVVSYNQRSLQYSLHCGYQIEGTLRKHVFKKGKYWDMIELGLFREEWLPIWKIYKKTGRVR